MYLSRLDLHGFKSFAQKTTVAFSPGVTAIVGPNGCGKSNVIDAVRWVLGEQRARLLRSDSMGGVIFNGAAGKRPLGMAEVSLTVENTRGVLPTEYTEVTVTRRLYRNGDSDYLLNGTVCRLRDVLDLFMDTGMGAGAYSVIELSMVEDILSDNAADRRRLFEEAAGVTKYKRRREQTFKRLAVTQSDLTRLDDIVEEVEKQVRLLERQAGKARTHARLTGRLRRLELALAAHDIARLEAERLERLAEARTAADAAEGASAQIATGEAALEADRTALVGLERALAERAAGLAEHADHVRGLDAERRVEAERVAGARRALDRLAQEATEAEDRARALDRETGQTAERLEVAATAAEAATVTLAEATAGRDRVLQTEATLRAALDAARAALDTAVRAAADARSTRDRTRDRREAAEAETARLADALTALDARGAPAAQADAARTALADARQALDQADADLAARTADRDAAREALDARRADEQASRSARDAARAEATLLDALLESGDGGDAAVDVIRQTTGATTLAESVACDDADRLALAAALAPHAQAVVVQSDAEADAAIAALRDADAGRATLFVLDRLASRAPAERSPTPIGTTPALDVARASDARIAPLLRVLLGNVFVARDLGEARRLQDQYPVARFVTRDGAYADASGAVHAGSAGAPAGSAHFGLRERQETASATLERADAALVDAEARMAEARGAVTQSEATRAQAEATRDAARKQAEAARDALTRLDAEAQARTGERSRLEARAADVAAQAGAYAPDADLDAAVQTSETARSLAERARDAAQGLFASAEADRRTADDAHAEARLAHARAQNDAATLRADRDRLAQSTSSLARRTEARGGEHARLSTQLETATGHESDLAGRLDAERTLTDALQTAAADAETNVLTARARISDAEATLRTVRAARDAATKTQTAAELRLAEIRARQETTAERLADDHGARLDDAEAELERLEAEDAFEPDAARAEVPRLRDQVRGLGAVNALALESYDEERERLGFLHAQRADVKGAETTLLETIDEINRTARERFDATFVQIQGAFRKIFSDLFGGDAEADVTLDGDDPLEAPVSITARPRGKRPVSIAQLSGGEKTLTATALLFAIYLVKPSPFCILDEVDAPLDDANVDRFMRLIRSFSDRTQFILVTHNKLTMEAADRMYGVTMPTPGVSRLVGVRLDEAEEVAAADAEP